MTYDPATFKKVVDGLKRVIITKYGAPNGHNYSHIAGLEAGGIAFASILAVEWGLSFIPIQHASQASTSQSSYFYY